MGLQGPMTAEWFARGRKALVAGVSSGFRYAGDDDTLVIDRGEGAYVYDMDGKRYVDYVMGFGPIILGHADPTVGAAVAEAAMAGTTFAMTTAREIEAAEKVRDAVPWVDTLRFTNTGTEATMHALRVARAWTGRDVIVKFEGAYHGSHDYLLWSTAGSPIGNLGSRRSPVPWQVSSGIPAALRSLIRVVSFNDLDGLERLCRSEGGSIAGVIVEPMMGNAFGMMPEPGFLEGLRAVCDENGSLLIFDEVKTGFRTALGGAVELFGVTPDIGTFAKSMGNGFPVAAVAGRSDIMNIWAAGGVAQAGTYSGNGVAAAATSATIDILATGEPYKRIQQVGGSIMEGITKICADRGLPAHVLGHPAMFGVFFGDESPRDLRDTAHHNAELYEAVIRGMIRRGVMPVDDGLEPWFMSAAHTMEDAAETLTAFDDSLAEALG
jgi:glutamate-1-semialdehyde 2,1-aminomutase